LPVYFGTFLLAVTMTRLLLLLMLGIFMSSVQAFEQDHAIWSGLLARHVHWNPAGTASTVDYDGMLAERPKLKAYLTQMSAVTRADFDEWPQPQRRAFLLNAYNAFTVELILGSYPEVKSIRDLGSVFSSPWKKRFFSLFGEKQSLDGIEHGLIRGAKDYDDPRIHFAANCASIGCPALRPEAYLGARLDAQLDDQTRRFLRDRQRNRFDAATSTLYLSSIFDWYGDDFERSFRGSSSVASFVASYPQELGVGQPVQRRMAAGKFDIEYSKYDWSLNRTAP